MDKKGERIAKRLARAGVASRRDAERMIAEGRVRVNGTVLSSPAFNVTDTDKITVDGNQLGGKERTRLWRYHKPSGLVTSHRDEKGRETIFDYLPEDLPRVISVGRLDLTSEGLLLLTNDGELSRHLELPATGWSRKYRVRAFGSITQDKLDKLKTGVRIAGISYGPIEATLEKVQGDNVWVNVVLREGKNREIRKVFEYLGLKVNRLIRTSYGPFQLGKLEEGDVEEIGYKAIAEALGKFMPDDKTAEDHKSPDKKSTDKKTAVSKTAVAKKSGSKETRAKPESRKKSWD
jgi:23S rRNA pseudouridine2605 synthase